MLKRHLRGTARLVAHSEFQAVGHHVKDLERFGTLPFTNVRLFGHFSAFMKRLYRMNPGRLLTRTHETLENTSNALHSMKRTVLGVHAELRALQY